MSNLDWNVFNAIAQDSGYEKKVAMANREMEYVDRMEKRAMQRQQEQMYYDEQVHAYMDKLSESMSYLAQDSERIKAVEADARKQVVTGIRNAGGDMKKFFLTGGNNILRDYKKNVLQSKEVNRALQNKGTYEEIEKALSKNKLLGNVNVTLKQNGKTIQKTVDVAEMLNLFDNGKIDKLSLPAQFDAPEFKPADFLKYYDSENPYQSSKVTPEQLMQYGILQKGLPEDVAAKWAQSIARPDANGNMTTNIYWGVKDFDWRKTHEYAFGRNGKGGSYAKTAKKFVDWAANVEQMIQVGDMSQMDWVSADGKTQQRMLKGNYEALGKDVDTVFSVFGLKLNEDGSYSGNFSKALAFTNLKNGQHMQISPSDYSVVDVDKTVTLVKPKDGIGESNMFLTARVRVSEDFAEDYMGELWWGGRTEKWGNVMTDVEDEQGEGRIVEVGIPIPMDKFFQDRLNTELAIKQDQVVGGMQYEDYVGGYMAKPEGTVSPFGTNSYVQQPNVKDMRASSLMNTQLMQQAIASDVDPNVLLQVLSSYQNNNQ
jgi:hypothetical protein